MKVKKKLLKSESSEKPPSYAYESAYIGLTESFFKSRHSNHVSSFHNANKKHGAELSKYIWQLKDLNVQYSINWKIIK